MWPTRNLPTGQRSPVQAYCCRCCLLAGVDSGPWRRVRRLRERRPPALLHLEIRDAIGPATSNFFLRALKRAQERNVQLVVLELDTPGGLDTAMREMIQADSRHRLCRWSIYVSPSGARAASAGTYSTVRQPRRRDGSGDESGGGDADSDRRSANRPKPNHNRERQGRGRTRG